jgi:hypothetical protein
MRFLPVGLVAVVEPVVRRRATRRKRLFFASLICLFPAFLVIGLNVIFNPSDRSTGWMLASVFCLLNIELCSYILAVPDKGIEGAAPVGRAALTKV